MENDEFGRGYFKCDKMTGSHGKTMSDDLVRCDSSEANLVGSAVGDGNHMPVLDFDFPCRLVPSTTEGHFHLYIDTPVEWSRYIDVLVAMKRARLLQTGFVDGSIRCGQSTVRPSWVKKEETKLPSDVK